MHCNFQNDEKESVNPLNYNFSVRCLSGDAMIPSLSSGVCPGVCLQKESVNPLNYDFIGGHKTLFNEWQYNTEKLMTDTFFRGHLTYVKHSAAFATRRATRRQLESNSNVFDSLGIGADSLPSFSTSFKDVLSQTTKTIKASFGKGGKTFNSSVDKITSTLTDIIKDGNEIIENLSTKVLSDIDEAGELTCSKLSNVAGGLKQSSCKADIIALDLVRMTIYVVEDSIGKGSKFTYSSYETSKEFLPPEIQNAPKLIEEKANDISRPEGMVYSTIEGLERSLGLDRSDPIIPFVHFIGTTSIIWDVYWLVTYIGYAGDLSPKMASELLSGKDNVVLVDRPYVLQGGFKSWIKDGLCAKELKPETAITILNE
ncbi:Dihydroorotate dehydrogenase B (NAD(+)) electron transfer subunit, partial [Bienertia sinuspersici]